MSSKLNRLFIAVFSLWLTVNCGYSPLVPNRAEERMPETENTVQPAPDVNLSWSAVDLPIYGDKLILHGDNLFVLGTEGIVSLNQKMEVRKLPPLQIADAYLTKDGGLTRTLSTAEKKENGNQDYYSSHLCPAEEAAFLSDVLYVYSICEHTSQLWKVSFNTNNTPLILTNFTYYKIDSDDKRVFGPTGLPSNINKILIPSFMAKGAALLTEDSKTGNLKVKWQAENNDGGIVGINFVGAQGWMLLSGGKVFNSLDGGENWRELSSLPSEAKDNVADLKFRNEQEGYIVGQKIILSTADGGKQWKVQNSRINNFLYEIETDENAAVARGDKNSLFINRKNSDKWAEIQSKPEGDISDILIFDGKLCILIQQKLYIANL